MGWYRHSNNINVLSKSASAKDIANNAIQLLNNGLNHGVVSNIFSNQMQAEDPTFDPAQLAGLDNADNLRNFLQKYITPEPQVNQGLGEIPGPQVNQGLGEILEPQVNQDLGEIPGAQDDWQLGEMPKQEDQGIREVPGLEEEQGLGEIPEIEEERGLTEKPEQDYPDLGEMFGPKGIDLENIFNRDDPITPVQRVIEEEGAAQDIREVAENVPQTERRDQFEDMTLDIKPEDIKGVEEVKRITQKEFSIPTTYKIKDDNLKKLDNRIRKMNKYKDSKGQSPMVVRFRTQDGQPSSEPVRYKKEKTNPQTGETFYVDYVDFVLEGEPPNPLGNPVKEIKNPDGTVSYEDVVYQIIGSIQLVWIEGYKPKEEKFKTEAEAIQHATEMNQKDSTREYKVGPKNKSKEFGDFYPSTYEGDWRTIVDRYPNAPVWKQKYKRGNPLHCDHCGTKKRGASSRRSIYVAIEYPAAQLIAENGKPRNPLPEEIIKGKQVWIGTGCVQGQKGALQFLEDLEKFKEVAMAAEKTGRASDSFGGSMSSPKGILPIMANYLAAGKYRPGRSGNWYKKRWGEGLSPQEFKEFKKYYFGRKRSDMRKAAIEVYEHEQAVEKYPEDIKNYQRNKELYPYLIENWRENGADPETKPVKPVLPEKPSISPPPGPKPLPWGEASEEDAQKAETILEWWREKQHDPTINFNDLEVNEELGASGQKMHNMISIAMHGQIDSSFFHYLPDLIDGQQREERRKKWEAEKETREEQQRIRNEENRVREEDQAYVDNESFNARRIRERQETEERAARTEQLGEQGVTLSDITQIPEGGDFTSEFKNIETKEGRTGRYSDFEDAQGNKYRIFDKYRIERRDPKYDFQTGESYILSGKKGIESTKWRNTPLNNVKVIDPNAPAPTALPIAEEVPEITPEAPVVPEVAPEAPIAREPVRDTILGDEERESKLKRISDISEYAKYVIENGKEKDSQDNWGNVIPGKEMAPEELILIYVDQVAKAWEGYDRQQANQELMDIYRQNGKQGLLNQIKLIPIVAKRNI